MDNETMESTLPQEKPKNSNYNKKLWEETKKILRISLPSMVFRVMSFGVLVVTQSFVGHISSIDLAAYALVQSISIRFINGILRLDGSRGVTIVSFITASILLPILIFASPIYNLLGQQVDISKATKTISLCYISFTYTLAFSLTTNMYLQAQMKNMINVWLSSGAMIAHVFFSWLFVYKLNLGIHGAMGSMIISQWGLVSSDWIYIFGGWSGKTWIGFSKLAFADLVPLVKLSISSGFMLCLELWYSSVLVLIAGYSNDVVVDVSAFSICLNLNAWEFMIALGLLAATSVRVSNELGRGDVEVAKFSVKVILCMAVALGLFFCILCIAFGHSYPYLFMNDVKVVEAASNLSVLLALTMLVSSFQAVFSGVAIGCGSQAKVVLVNAISFYAVGIPIGCLLTFVAKLGIKGIWIGMLVGMVVQVVALVVLTWRMDWKEEVNKTMGRLGRFLHESQGEANQS